MKQSTLNLTKDPTLRDFQIYIKEMINQRGFQEETVAQMFMLLLEECGEFAKAARKSQNIKIDKTSENFELHEEAADVFIYLLEICNHYNIDLEKAFRDKEEKNKKRHWE